MFFVDDDRRVYLGLLKEESQNHGFEIDTYCLMTNHVHVVGRPEKETSLTKALGLTHWRYTHYVTLGSDSFLSKLERVLDRRLRPLPRGRPRKETKTRRLSPLGTKNISLPSGLAGKASLMTQ